ncbi:O-Antigen ligase [Halopseudomonas yangmingensis]|uniref:O-Antigen ligase n=1 Tax=Halopseudomonas yangmingensis TaxID=1720063 RepID=A0A1I4T0R8_9GAMM|nr:O-Antigen ligase [Halopseudomonas yangmingensis]
MSFFVMNWRNVNKIEYYFTLALIAFVLSFVFLPSSKAVNNFYYVFLGLPALWMFFCGRFHLERHTPLLWLWVAFMLWMLLAAIQVQTLQYLKHWLYVAVFCGLIVLLVDYRVLRQYRLCFAIFLIFLLYILMTTAYYWYTGSHPVGRRVGDLPMRMSGPTYASIVLSAFFALGAWVLLSRNNWFAFVLCSSLVVFCTAYVLQSRAGVLGAFLVIGAGCFYSLWFAENWRYRMLVLLTMVIGASGLFWMFGNQPVFQLLVARADSGRFELWQAHYETFLECRTWLGCAPDYFADIAIFGGRVIIEHPHNIIFSVLLYHGWVGFLGFLTILALTFFAAWQQRNAWGCFLLVSLLMLMFEGSRLVNQPSELWLLIFLPCMLILAEQVRGGSEKV